MKIIISEKESYELPIPDGDIEFKDFKIFVKKIEIIKEFIETKEEKVNNLRIGSNVKKRTREDAVTLLKLFYSHVPGTEEMKKVMKPYGTTEQTVNQFKFKWIDKYKITAEELGMAQLPEYKAYSQGRPKEKVETKTEIKTE